MMNTGAGAFIFSFNPNLSDFKKYPKTIIQGLSEIGGLVAIFKVGFLIAYLHQKWYEQEVSDMIT